MILRRLAEGVRKQDWFTVVVEVLIVVVGIFLGLQVDDWNEARKDAKLEQRFLERLLSDTRYNIVRLERRRERAERKLTSLRTVIALLEANTSEKIAAEDMSNAFCSWHTITPAQYRSTTYDELVSTGRINIISDLALRLRMQMARALRERYQSVRFDLWDVHRTLAESFRPFIRWHLTPDSREAVSCSVDIDTLVGRPDLISVLVEFVRSNTVLMQFNDQEMEELEALLKSLQSEIDSGAKP